VEVKDSGQVTLYMGLPDEILKTFSERFSRRREPAAAEADSMICAIFRHDWKSCPSRFCRIVISSLPIDFPVLGTAFIFCLGFLASGLRKFSNGGERKHKVPRLRFCFAYGEAKSSLGMTKLRAGSLRLRSGQALARAVAEALQGVLTSAV
jgi:hypothetical protein